MQGNDAHDLPLPGGWQTEPLEQPADLHARRRWPTMIVLCLMGAGLVAGGVVGYRQNSIAAQWQAKDRQALAHDRALTKSLGSANSSIQSLDSTVADLRGQVSKLQAQVSSVADAKEKALDQNAVLNQLNAEANVVSQQLSTCVDDMNNLLDEFTNDVATNEYDPSLQSTAQTAGFDCTTAQADNQQLQSTLGGIG